MELAKLAFFVISLYSAHLTVAGKPQISDAFSNFIHASPVVFRIIVLRKIHFLFVLGKIFSRPVSAPLPIFCFPVNAMTIYTCTGRFDDKKNCHNGDFSQFHQTRKNAIVTTELL